MCANAENTTVSASTWQGLYSMWGGADVGGSTSSYPPPLEISPFILKKEITF